MSAPVAWRVRAMQADDLDAVTFNEQAAYPFPWSRGIFEDCLQFGYPSWVAESENGDIAGHAVMTLAVGEGHILNVCAHPHFQGMGLGRCLLNTLVDHAEGEAAQRMFLEVRASNHAAIQLYRSAGFEEVGVRRGYYPDDDGREDAVVLCRELKTPVAY
ncbi:ribosomal protein S18-alanine N-acetyltransferase [Oceanococcus atlanticus]|uniref:ribosomal protein S18-alanine N-acetyltransferase n=1 Tax=Oceanococcus atlanticus TaxID=1317117 RepID=UPI001F0AEAF1|nr:ribosomal protein S18-alanine N-acetyltransferase [Oceanococcus atlanticus]